VVSGVVGGEDRRVNDYERIARVIRHLDATHTDQPDLRALAAAAGLSPSHFHRLFSTWAGVTPKDFLQCLTLARAKDLLRRGESVLDSAMESGLSGPGRLHDLCVTFEAASPGEMKSGGRGVRLVAGFTDTPFGTCLVGESPRGICHLSFVDDTARIAALDRLRTAWPKAFLKRSDSDASLIASRIFRPYSTANERPQLRAFVRGSTFQVRVWRALLAIPPGGLTSYGRLAELAGQPGAARAVGSAVGSNPVAYLIPCHRVIRETGVLGGYRWDPIRKRAMIAWESTTVRT